MKIKYIFGAIAAFIILAVASCSSEGGKRINEGMIKYHIEYPKTENTSALVEMLPETMKMRFKDNNTAMEIVGYAGSFGLNFITNLKEKRNYSLLRVLFNKYKYVSDTSEISFGYGKLSDLEITETSDTMTICGYLCNRAKAKSVKAKAEFDLWYTKNITIESPNANNPFKKINGVLLKFDVLLAGIYMKMEAIEISDHEVADEYFQIPDDYTEVSKEKLEEIIHQFDKSID